MRYLAHIIDELQITAAIRRFFLQMFCVLKNNEEVSNPKSI